MLQDETVVEFMAYCHRSFLFASRRTAARRVLIDRRARPQLEIDCPRSYRLTTKLLNSRDDHAKERKKEGGKKKIRHTLDGEVIGGKILEGILFS